MKMSDVFALPVIVDIDYDIEAGPGQFFFASSDVSDKQSEMAAHAINHHDALVESLEMFEKAVDLWLPDMVSQEHEGEAEAMHKLRRHMLIVLAKAKGE